MATDLYETATQAIYFQYPPKVQRALSILSVFPILTDDLAIKILGKTRTCYAPDLLREVRIYACDYISSRGRNIWQISNHFAKIARIYLRMEQPETLKVICDVLRQEAQGFVSSSDNSPEDKLDYYIQLLRLETKVAQYTEGALDELCSIIKKSGKLPDSFKRMT